MDRYSPTPSSWLKAAAAAARWSLRCVLFAWAVFALVWGGLHWVIVPRIDEIRPMLESRATQLLGAKVQIGAITAESSGTLPSFELTDVRLFDTQNREALRLPRVLATLSPRSLLALSFDQLLVEQADLDIRRTPQGRWLVAGLDLSQAAQDEGRAADWFFSQPELVVRRGTLNWTDELRAAPPLALSDVDLVVRYRARRHSLRFDATPPADWGQRFRVMAVLRQPPLTLANGRWREWEGELYAGFEQIDLSRLRPYVDLGVDVAQGRGALRAWVDVRRADITSATFDLALSDVTATLKPGLEPLHLSSLAGRLGGYQDAAGFDVGTEALQFVTADGLVWPGGNVRLKHRYAQAGPQPTAAAAPARTELEADRLELAALGQVARRVPLDTQVHALLDRLAPAGLVEKLSARWQGGLQAPEQVEAKGRLLGLAFNADASRQLPGAQGVSLDFDLSPKGGKAILAIDNGALVLPGVFEEPVVPLTRLSTELRWQVQDEQWTVQAANTRFSNADAQGELQAKWQTAQTTQAAGGSGFPGVLDLQGKLTRADATRVHRYLPLVLDASVRHYVRDAVVQGSSGSVQFKVRGNLNDMPFTDPRKGEFRITAALRDGGLAYVPASLQTPGEAPWPALSQLQGDLVFDRASMQFKVSKGQLGQLPLLRAEAQIADMEKARLLVVQADARGSLAEMVRVVNSSPLDGWTGQVLRQTSATGSADLRLKLNLKLAALEKSTVQGSVTLAGNDLQMTPTTPRLQRVRGSVNFTDTGFTLAGVQARLLGGDARLDGGTVAVPVVGANAALATTRAVPDVVLRAQGMVTVDGLRLASELGPLAQLTRFASGSTSYNAEYAIKKGLPELRVNSNLSGLALNLPAPLSKTPDATLPLRIEQLALPDGKPARTAAIALEQWRVDLGPVFSLAYVLDNSGKTARVVRGGIAMGLGGDEQLVLPESGVVANIRLPRIDVDAWERALAQPGPARAGARTTGGGDEAVAGLPASAQAYLPTSLALRADELLVDRRQLNDVVAGGSRDGLTWRANIDARELNGYAEYRQGTAGNPGRVYARLARLTLAPSTVNDFEALLEEQPATVPALDIAVEDFELRGKRLGRVEIEAINRGGTGNEPREWRLNKFNITVPEAKFAATGQWIASPTPRSVPRGGTERRKTVMDFKFDIADSGLLLARMGMKDVVRRGQGKMQGQITWMGSPLSPDYASMGGKFNVAIESGQFLKADPGLAKLLGVLSLQSLPRRLLLDFRDVFSDGFAFDTLRGDVSIDAGMASTNNLQMKGVNAAVMMEGRADIARETQNLRVLVVPELNAGTASLLASAFNPAVALSTFVAQYILRKPLMEAVTQEFTVDGTWTNPKVTRVE